MVVFVTDPTDGTAPEDHAIAEFDPTVPVAEGVTVLEASAGTGKTHAVSSLVVAEVAGGRPLDQLLVVTFTRKATGELRERVWQRLSEAVGALDPVHGDTRVGAEADSLVAHLRRGTDDDRALRRRRLRAALSDFDAATIATTHGFCQQVLASLGVAGDAEREVELVEDVSDLVDDAVRDLYVRKIHQGGEILFEHADAEAIAAAVVNNPDCVIAPVDDNPVDRQRRSFALAVRRRIVDQKRKGRLLTYDDLLDRLDASLADDERGAIVAERLRNRFSMAVVDEFQDTDTVQWRILHKAFGAAPNRLVLVGDPKQAIYAFRGGDVAAYLEATKEADQVCGLTTSWRADQPLLDALDALFDGAQLGDEAIRHRRVHARPGATEATIAGPAADPPFSLRIAQRSSGRFELTKKMAVAMKPSVRRFLAEDVAAEAVRILNGGATIPDGSGGPADEGRRPIGPGDLAVLTRTHFEAAGVRDALQAAGVPAVVHGAGSVWATDAARHWLELLLALEQPASTIRVRAVTIGPFIGWDAQRLATATDAEWEEVDGLLHDWAVTARTHTIAALLRHIEAGTGLTARLLAAAGGDRRLSDLRHLAELLHARQASHPSTLAALAAWVTEQRADEADGTGESGADAARRRLETDAEAVSVHTVHGAKGLEFPIVLLPSLWDARRQDDDEVCVFHDPDGQRAISVGSSGGLRAWQLDRANDERDQEELRLLYVALTRARHRVVVWWATAADADRSPLARVLLGTDPATGAVRRRLPERPSEADIGAACFARGLAFTEATGSAVRPGEAGEADAGPERYDPPVAPAATLAVAPFARTFDRHWVRTSYSGLTRVAHEAGPHVSLQVTEDAEVDERAKVDEPPVEALAPGGHTADEDAARAAPPLPLADVPGGARVGTLAHEIFEVVDFTAPDLRTTLADAAVDAGAERIVPGHVDALLDGLAAGIETPLGPAWDDVRLRDLGPGDRLDELAFDLPLAGGDRPTRALLTMDAIADVFGALPAEDPLTGYEQRLRDPLLATEVRGFLSGSIDLVARIGERHVVVDYKTNHLAPHGETPTSWHYRPDALATAMADAHYPLQAALYAVALHRFLRWRLADYDPARHLGGVAYLFLRGMIGPDTPLVGGAPCGVFTWQPPASFVTDLSDLLDRGAP
ncbi:MAG: UvrD-helicase domain-containing protein [Acidimicrobiales bacterium]|nr:UvrD-helicase domain-containing protein [Acidimicrobiales bacterium]